MIPDDLTRQTSLRELSLSWHKVRIGFCSLRLGPQLYEPFSVQHSQLLRANKGLNNLHLMCKSQLLSNSVIACLLLTRQDNPYIQLPKLAGCMHAS